MSANIPDNLQRLRARLGLSLTACGRRRVGEGATREDVERARARWHSWETGRVRMPAEELPHAARVLECEPSDILAGVAGPPANDSAPPGQAA